jgi:hypothetical protein
VEALCVDSNRGPGLELSVVGGLVLVGRDVSDPAVEALVEPVDAFRGAEFFGRSPLPSRVEAPWT